MSAHKILHLNLKGSLHKKLDLNLEPVYTLKHPNFTLVKNISLHK